MNLTAIAHLRLISQQIASTKFDTAKDLVAWMGAMQAQDFEMVKWAAGLRLPNSTIQTVDAAIDSGEVIRTHLLRPTWHIVSAADIHWMLELTAPHILSSLKARHKELELSGAVLSKSNKILEKALREGKHRTREELLAEFRKARIPTGDNRASHLLLCAELDGIVCSGASKMGKPTYALLEERAPKSNPLKRDEALATLATKYFTSHGPATLQDFAWWSGLPAGDAKQALELAKPRLVPEIVDSQIYWLANSHSVPKSKKEAVHLLPAYDEFIISYKDRTASLPFENHSKAISNNGLFRPTIVVNGQVTGIWKRTIKKNKVIVETEFFDRPKKTTQALVEKAFVQFGRFWGKEVGSGY